MEETPNNSLQAQYNALQPFPTGHIAPRKGFYLINSIYYDLLGAFENVPMAKATWSPDLDDIHTGLQVDIQLISLMLPQAIGPKINSEDQLLSNTIEVIFGMSRDLIEDRSCVIIYAVKWEFRHLNLISNGTEQ